MPPYTAQRQSLNEIGGPYDAGPGVDYGRILDAASSGASSLIRQMYAVKLQQRQFAREDEQRRYERTRDAEDRTYARGRDTAKDALEAERFAHQKAMDEAKLLGEGYHDEAHTEPTGRAVRMPSGGMTDFGERGAITRAMTGGTMPAAPMEDVPTMRTTIPAGPHIDLERNTDYRVATDRARITAESAAERAKETASAAAQRQAERLTAAAANAKYLADRREELAKWLRANPVRNGAIGRGMTGNQRNAFNLQTARGMLEMNGGDINTTVENFRNTPEDQRPEGMTEDHFVAAYGQYIKGATGQILSTQRAMGGSIPESAAARDSAVTAVKPPTLLSPPPGAGPKPGAGAKPKAAVTPPAAGAKADTTKAAPTKAPMDRAKELQAAGKTRDEILTIMRDEGYSVIDSSKPDSGRVKK